MNGSVPAVWTCGVAAHAVHTHELLVHQEAGVAAAEMVAVSSLALLVLLGRPRGRPSRREPPGEMKRSRGHLVTVLLEIEKYIKSIYRQKTVFQN